MTSKKNISKKKNGEIGCQMDKKIILTVHRPEPSFCGVVKLDRDAEGLVKQLQRETGMTAKYIVSQIIIQGFDLVEIKEDKDQ